MHARITVQLRSIDQPAFPGGDEITVEQIADAIRGLFDAHGVTSVRINAMVIGPSRLEGTSRTRLDVARQADS